jgi:hypothetical protein
MKTLAVLFTLFAEFLEPKGRYATKAEVIEAFQQGRAKIVGFVKSTQEDLRAHGLQSPAGYVDGYQFLLSAAAHGERHAAQISEVKASAGYPSKQDQDELSPDRVRLQYLVPA